ncbi:DUF397 domain-containing protein [Kitasatospora sp. NPDC096204]|uniref:DUF397 domain-containing protein n=1 Tax=Kitasatospora sp. NPDC096204 TaxID=3364094 RepID=UPI0037F34C02
MSVLEPDLAGAVWRKSSHSNNGGTCVEVDDAHPGRVRDSKDPNGPILAFPVEAWASFVVAVRGGEFGDV